MYASMQNEDKLKLMLKDLGRSTLRGIRRCYKCGTLNGTRGVVCKNKACDVVFTEAGRKKKHSVEVCKLQTSSSPQVFSVRVKEKGPDFRGFVQLPAVQSNLEESDTSYLSPVTALCFVESCQRLFNTNILKCHERGLIHSATSCQHIQSAMRCCSDAIVLRIDYKTLHSLKATQFIKDRIWQLNTETSTCSIVQRVSKSIMAVKCKVTTKHPLGFLHITFSSSQRSKEKETYLCTCAAFKNSTKCVDSSKNCIHYYACVAAFASDDKLAAEFAPYVLREKVPETYTIEMDPNDDDTRLVEIFSAGMNSSEGVVLSKDDENNFILPELTSDLDGLTSIVDVSNELEVGLDNQSLSPVIARLQESTVKLKTISPRRKKITPQGITVRKKEKPTKKEIVCRYLPLSEADIQLDIVAIQVAILTECLKKMSKCPSITTYLVDIENGGRSNFYICHKILCDELFCEEQITVIQFFSETLDPNQVTLPFINWLASVTETINQTMHVQFDGKPEPLIFQIPHNFFDCLMERLMASSITGNMRKRLPVISTYKRENSPPIGIFYKYAWQITSLVQAKAIFDTPLMTLKESRSFVQKADGTYEDIASVPLEEGLSKREGERSIRPVELKTFLKIGTTSPNQKSPSILTINWTPNLLPISSIGELQIIFEFGHSHPYFTRVITLHG